MTRVALFGLLLLLPNMLWAGQWRQSGAGSLEFETSFEGVAIPGQFQKFETRLNFNPENLTEASIVVTVDITATDMFDQEINDEIAGPDWFDYASYPQATFNSTDFSALGSDSYLMRGELELKGRRATLEIPFSWQVSEDTARISGQFETNRTIFEIGSGEWLTSQTIGWLVKLKFEVGLDYVAPGD